MRPLIALLVAAAACGSPHATPDAAPPDAAPPDAAPPDAAVIADAAPDAPPDANTLEVVQVAGDPLAPRSCDSLCTAYTYACTDACPGQQGAVAGLAIYDDPNGNLAHRDVAACADAVPATITVVSETYTLDDFRCCCLAPIVTRIAEDPAVSATCDTVCTQHGLTCTDRTYWGATLIGGMLDEYDDHGLTVYQVGRCASAPPIAYLDPMGNYVPLSAITCGCS